MAQKVGGQAVFRGVMLRDEEHWAVAVRTPDGDIAVRREALPTWGRRWMQAPILRGIVGVGIALPTGLRAMRWSRQQGLPPASALRSMLRVAGALFALLVVPPFLTDRLVGGIDSSWLHVVVNNVLTVASLVAFSAITGRLADLRMLFEYHGAEHKVVAAHEARVPVMTPEAAAPFSTRHVRCGTSLLLVIAVVAAVVSMFELPAIVAFPLVLGVAVELQGRAANNVHLPWVRALVRPGIALQRLTTREPSAAQLEVAIAACQALTTSAAQPSSVETVAVPV